MKLVIFTPASKKSAIAKCSALISGELLTRGHQVTIVRTESEAILDSAMHNFGVSVMKWTDKQRVENIVRNADSLIYQIGDNYEFHQGGLAWLEKWMGTVVLHDFFLGHLFWARFQHDYSQAKKILCTWYSEDVANDYFNYSSSEAFIEGTRKVAPMTEWICSMANSVITHSGWESERVLKACAGPVRLLPLGYNKPSDISSKAKTQASDCLDKFVVLTIGHVNLNKRAESVIKAIANSSVLKKRCIYHLVGAIQEDMASRLTDLAKTNGVTLVISGELEEHDLISAIEECDVMSCLRWPCLEAASASLIEALLNGKPTIVTDAGFYSELPSSCVVKINYKNELAELQKTLELLYKDPAYCKTISEEGRRWASMTFTVENYVSGLIETALALSKSAPILNAIHYFSNTISRWSEAPDAFFFDEETLSRLKIFENLE